MRTIRAERSKGLRRKICVACGYDGPAIRGDLDEINYACPHCRQDLYARPPMSYAEMEGLVPVTFLDEILIQIPQEHHDPPRRWWTRTIRALLRRLRINRRAEHNGVAIDDRSGGPSGDQPDDQTGDQSTTRTPTSG